MVGVELVTVTAASRSLPSSVPSARIAASKGRPSLRPGFSESGRSVKSTVSTSKCTSRRSKRLHFFEGTRRGALRVGAATSSTGVPFSPRRPIASLVLGCLLGAVGKEEDILVSQQGKAAPKWLSSSAALLAEHVRHAHPVERPLANAGGHVEVGVDVEVDQSQSSSGPFGGQGPATVPSSMVQSPPTTSGRCPAACAFPTLPAVSRTTSMTAGRFCARRLALVRPPAPHTATVPVVHHLDARAGEPPEEVGLPKGLGPFSWPGAKAPMLVGTPIRPSFSHAPSLPNRTHGTLASQKICTQGDDDGHNAVGLRIP